MKWILMEVAECERASHSLVGLKLIPKLEGAKFVFQPGQHVKIRAPRGTEVYFAIASEPEEKRYVEFLLKDEKGTVAHELCKMKTGDSLKVSPAFGKGYPVEKYKSEDILLIGIGSGLAPLRSVLKSILRREHQFGRVTLVYGARRREDIPYPEEFDLWAKKFDLRVALTQPRGSEWPGFVGRVTKLLPTLTFHPQKTVAFICGNRPMEEEVRNLLEIAGISKDNIHTNL